MTAQVLCITDGRWSDYPDQVYAWPKDEWSKWWIFHAKAEQGGMVIFEMPLWRRWKYDREKGDVVCVEPFYPELG